MLGVGGMGAVVASKHVELKFMLPAAAAMPEAVARFLREARASAGCGAST
jgi:serine/threonine-protein kinase